MTTNTIGNERVSFFQQTSLFGLIALFISMGALRLNDCDLFNPDSPRYLIYSQSIVNLGDYRATDVPGSPLYSWRPPGLSLLIAPVMAIRPYDVVAAKFVVLMTGALLLWVMFQYAASNCGNWAAIMMTCVIATAPTFLVLATEVLSEIPYSLAVLTVLWILGRSTFFEPSANESRYRRLNTFVAMAMAIIVMAFTPWLRTAGVALVAAVAIWSITSRQRLKWLSVAFAGSVGLGLLAWRNAQAGGENYVGSLFNRLRDRGVGPFVASGIETVSYYVSTMPGLLLPGLTNERAWYAPLALDGSSTLDFSGAATAWLSTVIVSFALLGMWRRRDNGGSLALLYTAIYCACLIVWPWRHERFLWPLFPVLLAFVPAGFTAMMWKCIDDDTINDSPGNRVVCDATGRLPKRMAVENVGGELPTFVSDCLTVFSFCAGMLTIVFCAWQSVECDQLVRVNHEFVSDRDAFHTTQLPGFYFSNWRRAGTWLNQNTPPYARVLTWHAAVAGTSHRFQKRVQFESMTPEKIRQQIEGFSARYLVVPDGQFGDGFGWQQLLADPAIRLNVVYREHDVVILEVEPNRTGQVSKTAYLEWLEEQMRLSDDARKRLPQRIDVAIRNASLLHETGHTEDAIRVLQDLYAHGTRTVRVCADLGWMLFETEEFAEAARFLDIARTLPNAESIAGHLADGVARAEERIREKRSPDSQPSMKHALNRVKSLMSGLKFAAAEGEMDRIVAMTSEDPEVIFVRGVLHHRVDEIPQAIECYDRALTLGFVDAEKWMLLIRFNEAMLRDTVSIIEIGGIRETVDPANPSAHLRLASLFRERGWSGRALATLEIANERFPNQPPIQTGLAELYRSFARPELAAPLFEAVLATDSNNESAKNSLAIVKMALTEPHLEPRTMPSVREPLKENREQEEYVKRNSLFVGSQAPSQ